MNQVPTGYPYEVGAQNPFRMPPAVIPPCPLCSGEVSRDDPAAQALDWGVRVAEAKEGESGFWKAMTAAEVYRDARLGHATEDPEPRDVMDGLVSRVLDSAAGPCGDSLVRDVPHELGGGGIRLGDGDGNGDDGNGDDGGEEEEPDEEPADDPDSPLNKSPKKLGWIEVAHDARPEHFSPGGRGPEFPSGGPVCCPEYFKYATSWYRIWRDPDRHIGAHFNADAKYYQVSDAKPLCYCLCCRMRQFVQILSSGSSGEQAPTEDCIWKKKKDDRETRRTVVDGLPPADAEVVYCVGDRPRVTETGELVDFKELEVLRKGVGTVQQGPCRTYTTDEPGMAFKRGVVPGKQFKAKYYGVVTDTCRNDLILAYSTFVIDIRSLSEGEREQNQKFPWSLFNKMFLTYREKYGIAIQGEQKDDVFSPEAYDGGEHPP